VRCDEPLAYRARRFESHRKHVIGPFPRSYLLNTKVGWWFILRRFSVTRLYSVDDRMISGWWIGKDVVGSGRGLILRYYTGIFLEGLRKIKKTASQDGRSLWPTFEPGTSRVRSRSVSQPLGLGFSSSGNPELWDEATVRWLLFERCFAKCVGCDIFVVYENSWLLCVMKIWCNVLEGPRGNLAVI
jgi:hypothetical protein